MTRPCWRAAAKGMRRAWTMPRRRRGLSVVQERGASKALAMDSIFIEKFVTQPRHIEISGAGRLATHTSISTSVNCPSSAETRSVIEESALRPFPRRRQPAIGHGRAVLRAGPQAVDVFQCWHGLEFIRRRRRIFYFLEMNTRLQVDILCRTDHRH